MARGLPNERLIVEHPLALHELVPLRHLPHLSAHSVDSGLLTVLSFRFPKHKLRQRIARILVILLVVLCPILGC